MRKLLIGLALVLGFVVAAPAATTFALTDAEKQANCEADNSSFFGLPNWYKYLDASYDSSSKECNLDFDIASDIPKVLLAVFEIILRVGGMVAVVFVIVGGVQYTISQGEPDKTKAARQTIINALVGLFIALMAVSIVNLIGGVVAKPTNTTPANPTPIGRPGS